MKIKNVTISSDRWLARVTLDNGSNFVVTDHTPLKVEALDALKAEVANFLKGYERSIVEAPSKASLRRLAKALKQSNISGGAL